MKYSLTIEEFRAIYSKVPRLTVDLVVKTDKGILLTLRDLKSWKGKWHLPGGTVLYKESVKEAIQRVAQEEIGVSVKIEKLLGYCEYPSEEKERGYGFSIALVFLCIIKSGELRGSYQAEEIQFFKKLPENTIQETKEFLQKTLTID